MLPVPPILIYAKDSSGRMVFLPLYPSAAHDPADPHSFSPVLERDKPSVDQIHEDASAPGRRRVGRIDAARQRVERARTGRPINYQVVLELKLHHPGDGECSVRLV